MARIKIKIQDLFERLGMNDDFEDDEKSYKFSNIKIKNHEDKFVDINEFVRKRCDSFICKFDNGISFICSDKHILLTKNGLKEIKDIDKDDDILISKENDVGFTKMISKDIFKKNDILYDICLDEPYLFKDYNGFIHHNSLVTTYIVKILLDNKKINRAIIVVPTQSLVEQFYDDMVNDYGIKRSMVGRVYSKYKEWDKNIVVSTWQTLSRNHEVLDKYECIAVDETHMVKAVQLSKILRKSNAKYRYGFTGTLHSAELDNLNVKSYIGPVICDYPASQLAEWGYLAECHVNVINIDYKEEYDGAYDDVKDAIFNNEYRLGVISSIARNVDGNLLVLVGKVEKEGKVLKEFLENANPDKEVVFLSGKDKTEVREHWRKECGRRNDIILICTYGIYQQGINIPTLKFMLMAAPFKSKIRVLQSIGRTLRRHANKTDGAQVFDIIDNVKYFDRQGGIRLRYYTSEAFKIHETGTKEC